jgi:hypothetical protein
MLSWTNAKAFEELIFDHAPLTKEIERLKGWIGGRASEKPALDLVLEALQHFDQSLVISGLREAQLVCYGCVEPYGDKKNRLIEDERRFPRLLDCIEKYRPSPRAFRRCYRGLLSGYFQRWWR